MNKVKLIFDLLVKREKQQLVFIFFLMLIMGFLETAGVSSVGPFISIVTNPDIIHNNKYLHTAYDFFDFSSETDFIIAFGIIVIILLTVSNLFFIFVNFILSYYTAKRRLSISERFLERYLLQPYDFYLGINTSTLIKNIVDDIITFVRYILFPFLNLITHFLISLFIVLLLIIINPLLALAIVFFLGLSYLIIFAFTRNLLARKGKEREVQNKNRYKIITEAFGGIKDVKISGKEKIFIESFSIATKKFSIADAMSTVINDSPKYILEIIALGGIIGVLIYLIFTGVKFDSFFPILAIYTFGAYRLLPSLQIIFKAIASIKYHYPILLNLRNDYITLPPGEEITTEDVKRMPFKKEIELSNICFRYPDTHQDIIKGQNLVITANTAIALVGNTGCGKTTLVDIILGLLKPQSGNILVDGIDITQNNCKSWQKNLGYVPQSIFLTDDTIRSNIAFGIPAEKIDNDAVVHAAKLANIHDFIVNDLEKGYDTVIGERGIKLSGGQRQRIGIARAVYHDPPVLILDEATSALDSLTENAVLDAINNMIRKKTIIMIAHRMTTVKNCDVIYFMEKGRIVEQGNYEELYKKSKEFKKMAEGK